MLEANHFFLFFKVTNDLLKRLFKNGNLLLVRLNLFVLLILSANVFLFGALIDVDVTFEVFIEVFQMGNLFFVVFD